MDDARKIKKVLGVLIHLSEHRGRNIASDDLTKSKLFQKKSEELRSIITKNLKNWNHIDDLTSKFSEFQKTLDNDRKNLK